MSLHTPRHPHKLILGEVTNYDHPQSGADEPRHFLRAAVNHHYPFTRRRSQARPARPAPARPGPTPAMAASLIAGAALTAA